MTPSRLPEIGETSGDAQRPQRRRFGKIPPRFGHSSNFLSTPFFWRELLGGDFERQVCRRMSALAGGGGGKTAASTRIGKFEEFLFK
jgi:hypothetical protein